MRVAIIGSGPAGLFCADRLVDACDVTIFEAGFPMEKRICPGLECKACERCQILEGEGGAGGLSDGKNTYSLSRGTQMESIFEKNNVGWMKYIDEQMVKFAGEGVWYEPIDAPQEFESSPLEFDSYHLRHVGSDGIRRFVRGFVDLLKSRKVRFDYSEAYPTFRGPDSPMTGIRAKTEKGWKIEDYDIVVIAAGLQGIPWIEEFMEHHKSPLGLGPAGFGIRLEMDAKILTGLHDQFYDYKIVYYHKESDLTLRSFCCNQRGMVLNERHTDLDVISVNGHSFLDPNLRTESSNMAIIAKIPETFAKFPQQFVRSMAKAINHRAGGSAYEPLLGFMGLFPSFDSKYMTNKQSFRSDMSRILFPYGLLDAFRSYILELNKIVPIISRTSVVYAPEIKYYGRRVNVDKKWKSRDIGRLYVIGSGSGHIDSFVAAALSGIVAAENIKKGGNQDDTKD